MPSRAMLPSCGACGANRALPRGTPRADPARRAARVVVASAPWRARRASAAVLDTPRATRLMCRAYAIGPTYLPLSEEFPQHELTLAMGERRGLRIPRRGRSVSRPVRGLDR